MTPRLVLVIAVLMAGSVFFPGLINLHDSPAWIVVNALVGAVFAAVAYQLGARSTIVKITQAK